MKGLELLQDNDRYYNWYHGFTRISVPGAYPYGGQYNWITTSALSGTISTQYFGDKFDADKVERYMAYQVITNSNVTLNIEIEKLSIKDVSDGEDKFAVSGQFEAVREFIHEDISNFSKTLSQQNIRNLV